MVYNGDKSPIIHRTKRQTCRKAGTQSCGSKASTRSRWQPGCRRKSCRFTGALFI